jgi:hypothetical protein
MNSAGIPADSWRSFQRRGARFWETRVWWAIQVILRSTGYVNDMDTTCSRPVYTLNRRGLGRRRNPAPSNPVNVGAIVFVQNRGQAHEELRSKFLMCLPSTFWQVIVPLSWRSFSPPPPAPCPFGGVVKKAKNARSLSPPSSAPHRIGAVVDEKIRITIRLTPQRLRRSLPGSSGDSFVISLTTKAPEG